MAEESASTAASKVQEAAASLQQAATQSPPHHRSRASSTIVRDYFQELGERELDGAVSMWAPGGREHVRGMADILAPEGMREFFGEMLEALPDLRVEVISTTSEDDRCAAHWRFSGTFAGPGQLGGVAPTGDPVVLEGLDLFTVRDGLIRSNDAFTDTMSLPRQVGMMPASGSTAEQRMRERFNAKTRLTQRPRGGRAGDGGRGRVADPGPARALQRLPDRGRRRRDPVRRRRSHDDARRRERRGPARRHRAHRAEPRPHRSSRRGPGAGGAGALPPAEVQDAEGSGGFRYWPRDLDGLPAPQRQIHRLLHRYAYGGPVEIAAHGRRGRRDRRLSGRAPPRPRARADRAVARVRPPGARQRLL